MRVLIQRVKDACITIEGNLFSEIGKGLLIFLGVSRNDGEKEVQVLIEKIQHLRIFEDDAGKMNCSLHDIKGDILIVSQFTLYADCRKGRRPSFIGAAPPLEANRWYEFFVNEFRKTGFHVETGKFQAMMAVSLTNDGPVTILLDTEDMVR